MADDNVDSVTVNVKPGMVILCPPGYGEHYSSYLYLEGPIRITHQGFQAYSTGILIEVHPWNVNHRIGGRLNMQTPGGMDHIQGDVYFGDDYAVKLPGARILLIHPMINGPYQFIIGQKGKKGYIQPITPLVNLKVRFRHASTKQN